MQEVCRGVFSGSSLCGKGRRQEQTEKLVCDDDVTGPLLTPSESGQEGWLVLYARSSPVIECQSLDAGCTQEGV